MNQYSLQEALLLEQLAAQEAAAAGMDLPTYAAVLQAHEQQQLAAQQHAQLEAETAQAQHLHLLAAQEAAAAGMDLPTYIAVLQAHEQQQLAQLQEQQQLAQHQQQQALAAAHAQGCDPATLQALAEQEAAAAGMDLPTYAATLQQTELALLEEAAYLEGVAQHEAELARQQQAAMPPAILAHLQQLQIAQLQQAQALGLL
ncbi:hypothetical protein [Massilia sp. NR 4-1]|uniref:hypothetical protein n=1 Tax=Massilia sp. NR 4-1 TaxID=1678028 RepID=UPI00067D355E|nr:hypothetical protein [Massilia sp. NR 4-1]AKU20810.1 hypothetical protein ACZ75_04105 [Massilia sp. NR 4-1]